MSITCSNIINMLNKSIENTNTLLIDHMTCPNLKYEWICIKPNVTYGFYFDHIKEEWEYLINGFINQPHECSSRLSDLLEIYKFLESSGASNIKNIVNILTSEDQSGLSTLGLDSVNIDNLILDVIAENLMNPQNDRGSSFQFHPNFFKTMINLGETITVNCQCRLVNFFKFFVKKYKKKYRNKFEGKTKEEVKEMLRTDYENFKNIVINLRNNEALTMENDLMNELSTNLTNLYNFSMERELDTFIPDELGSLKAFFIRVINQYYKNLHPIIWLQIFKNIIANIFIDLPFGRDEIFSFVSKYVLLNSGPFILKILQTIRPVLDPETAKKYNLTRLTYPLLKPNQIELILKKILYNYEMYNVLENFSASVGHVCKVSRVDTPDHVFIIKIIKPLAIAQSCWEFQTLHDLYPEASCEKEFLKNMLESNGRELNVHNEMANIDKGYKYYTAYYRDVFNVDIEAQLTSVQNVRNVLSPYAWYALAMTLAPGIPLSKLVENDLVKNDTLYRAKLHRCLDLLLYKYFSNIVLNGFYHGDLHAGNIFFSFENKQMTLIDFGAVGELDLYSQDSYTKTLLDIVIMSLFYNYDEIFDTLTQVLNSKCVETQINVNDPKYHAFREKLIGYKIQNILDKEKKSEKSKMYEQDIFDETRIRQENNYSQTQPVCTQNYCHESIYSYLEHKPKTKETIIENRDVLPKFTDVVDDKESIDFTYVLQEMIKFYASMGVNIAIKFNDFYEFQKSYILLLGVLKKVYYSSYRTRIAIRKAILNWKNLPKLLNVRTIIHVIKSYKTQSGKYKAFQQNPKHVTNNPSINDDPLSKYFEATGIAKSDDLNRTNVIYRDRNRINPGFYGYRI